MIPTFRITIKGITSNSVCNYGKKFPSIAKQSKLFGKMLAREANRKEFQPPTQSLLKKSILSSAFDNEGSSRRLTVLNKTYMEEISMMINCSEYKNELADLGIEITKVRMAKGLNFLSIYWMSQRSNIKEEEVTVVLSKALKELQQEMGSLRYISKVPYLRFVRDLRLESETYLAEIFNNADFGKDFEPTHKTRVVMPDFIQKPYEFPEMRQDILGLDYLKIRRNIEDRLLKFRAINIEWIDEEKKEEKPHKVPEKLIAFSKKEFIKFYNRRRILEMKMKKLQNKNQVGFEDFPEDEFQPPEEDDKQFDHLLADDDDDLPER